MQIFRPHHWQAAERMYKACLYIQPNNTYVLSGYAHLFDQYKKDAEKAEKAYIYAIHNMNNSAYLHTDSDSNYHDRNDRNNVYGMSAGVHAQGEALNSYIYVCINNYVYDSMNRNIFTSLDTNINANSNIFISVNMHMHTRKNFKPTLANSLYDGYARILAGKNELEKAGEMFLRALQAKPNELRTMIAYIDMLCGVDGYENKARELLEGLIDYKYLYPGESRYTCVSMYMCMYLSVCMYFFMYVCFYVCMYVCMYVCIVGGYEEG